jgi:hypothetical protein
MIIICIIVNIMSQHRTERHTMSRAPRQSAAFSIDHHTLAPDSIQSSWFLMRSFRLWLTGLRYNAPDCLGEVWNDFASRFGSAAGKEALAALAESIKTIQLQARRRIHFHPPCCRYLSPDEAGYLGLIAACQAEDGSASRQRAEWLVRSAGQEALLAAGHCLARLLRDRGVAIAPFPSGSAAEACVARAKAGHISETMDDAHPHWRQGLK